MEKLLEEFSLGLFVWQTILFVALLLLLKKFAWKPILDAVNERETSIRESLSAAEKAREDMEAVQADNKRILKQARSERDALLAEAKTESTKIVNQAKEDAKAEADKITAQAQVTIQNEKNAAINELKGQVASLSIDIAAKVLQTELKDQAAQEKFVSELVKEIEVK
ncbi:F0F1 ATP synthase subunit B [Flavobacteriaceae bacterium]|uniref:F0F1 ATP synthase subunit B n=1 Tax=Candidatus Arcticimaribacter forsetii TaxID=2820661 RepID=UPI0020775BCD|nr:F0F1 ATP synthase subunit B [Candidatus Arcticimaribacter forsetii]MDA8639674.1 F0F1 ATP synthase subunit B [Flavobacteriaceae bacterium]MDA8698652.1 F0F1 ATP synthase subunit B [Flavobacteriaceae bacterium]MDB2325903.1 F0F1 ATP synthase subunit B [Flavobacteriaceae bacterium]MDB2329584.1 F0F1 ATP synthase subunit B [Flavobacteriaceae bacterium]MDB2346103.1 F0F1 ATP synthase subunit B [Flavobacteriaceae bacterium]